EGPFCWGNNAVGQLGGGAAEPLPGVVGVQWTSGEPLYIASGLAHTCASDGQTITCWGGNLYGQLGRPAHEGVGEPAAVAGLPEGASVQQLTAGAFHTCALLSADPMLEVWCWGDDRHGALGDGDPG